MVSTPVHFRESLGVDTALVPFPWVLSPPLHLLLPPFPALLYTCAYTCMGKVIFKMDSKPFHSKVQAAG